MKTFSLNYFKCNETKLNYNEGLVFENLYFICDNLMVNEVVYLLSVGDDVFISEDDEIIKSILKMFYNEQSFVDHYEREIQDIFIQEYSSYEEAYKVALSIKETSKLCYNHGNLN